MASPEWNFGHVAGACDVGYLGVGDDAKLVTCGADNAVYVRNPTSGEVEHSFTETHGDAVNVLCVAPNGGDKFVTGSDDCSVKLFSFDGTKIAGEFEKNVTRFSLPVRALAWSTDGTFLAAGGEDSMVKVVDMSDNSIAMELPHRGKCIKSVSFDPKGEFLSACDDAGVLTVWALKTITKKDGGDDDDDDENAEDDTHKSSIEPGDSVMSATVAPVTNNDSPAANGAKWRGDGLVLAAPGRENDVTFFKRDEWMELEKHRLMAPIDGEVNLDDDDTETPVAKASTGHADAVSFVEWSPNGKYLLTSGVDCLVAVWDVAARKIIAKFSHDAVVCGAEWKGDANAVALVDVNGQWAVWRDVVPAKMTSPFAAVAAEELEFWTGDRGVAGDANDAANDDDDEEPRSDDDLADMDEESYYLEMERRRQETRKAAEKAKAATAVAATATAPQSQPPFQVGAVAVDKSQKSSTATAARRFLCYNMMGTVVTTGEPGSDFNSIEMAFHDTSRQGRVPTITDYHGYDLASLGERGCALASPGGKDGACATLFYRPFESWAHLPEWRVTLPKGERAVAVACGKDWVAVVTSERLLRTFTQAGAQKHIVQLAGTPVTCVGKGDSLLVAHHATPPVYVAAGAKKDALKLEQKIHFVQYDVSANGAVLAQGALPVAPGATLTWLGFVEDACSAVAFGSSDGAVSVRTPDFGGAFAPVFRSADTKTQDSEHHWVVAVSVADDVRSGAGLYCVVCRSGAGPNVHPKPVLTPMPLSTPVALPEGSSGDLEDVAGKARVAVALASCWAERDASDGPARDAVRQVQAACDKASLRLFHASCKAERPARAADIAKGLHLTASMHGALKLANALQQPALAQRVTSLIEDAMAAAAAAEHSAKMHAHTKYQSQMEPSSYYDAPSALETPGQGPAGDSARGSVFADDDANPFARRASVGPVAQKNENDLVDPAPSNPLKSKAGYEANVGPGKKSRAANPFARK